MQTVLQEAGPQSSGRGQSQGHDRGGLQETRAHKVRTCVCRQIKVKKSVTPFVVIEDQTLSVFFFFLLPLQLCSRIHRFLFHPVLCPPLHAGSKVCHRLVGVLQEGVRNVQFVTYL